MTINTMATMGNKGGKYLGFWFFTISSRADGLMYVCNVGVIAVGKGNTSRYIISGRLSTMGNATLYLELLIMNNENLHSIAAYNQQEDAK